MIFNLDFGGGKMTADKLHFGGSKLFAADGSAWEAALLSSGTLTVDASALVDLALVAGGMPGKLGGSGLGGVGGKGGGIALFAGVWLRRGVTYTVHIGGSGEDTTLTGSDGSSYTAVSGNGSDGGTPSSSRNVAPTPGSNGTRIWGGASLITTLSGRRYGPGGGPGGYCSADYAYYSSGSGGSTGGGDGGSLSTDGSTQATSGAANTGAGGGGAWRNDAANQDGSVGLGGSGILMIRSHEEVAA